ncbi:hypothetical protein [Zymomonas mobilis]|uniref:hypothetical protein n=1 Tax=Zymomonas mobilis TaxID=542 RepID=UPI0021C32E66|nr:hypothetical protein [Zymomonas mobilis]MCP9308676.1 hypothetical protein [Zymomonas mobilis]
MSRTSDIIQCMRKRLPWGVAYNIFTSLNLEKGLGWPGTEKKVLDGDTTYESKEKELELALEEHLICGEKIVRFYELLEQDIDTLRKKMVNLLPEIPNDKMTTRYPILLDGNDLNDRYFEPQIISVRELVDGWAVSVGVKRTISIKHQADVANLKDVPQQFSNCKKITGIEFSEIQAIDVLWVPKSSNIIELRIDYLKSNKKDYNKECFYKCKNFFVDKFGDIFGKPINLFPILEKIYKDNENGTITELGFMISSGAQKLEKSRRGGTCCRVEAYHLGGTEKLDFPIQVYRENVMWKREIAKEIYSSPEIGLYGLSHQTALPNPELFEMFFFNCMGVSDYEFVKNNILGYL